MVTESITQPSASSSSGLLSIGRRNTSATHLALPGSVVANAQAQARPAAEPPKRLSEINKATLSREERRDIRKFTLENKRVTATSASIVNIMAAQLERDRKQNQLLREQLEQLKSRQGIAVTSQQELTAKASGVEVDAPTQEEMVSVFADLADIRAESQRKKDVYERDLEEVRASARELQEELGDTFVVDMP